MYYGKRKKNLAYYAYSGTFVSDTNFIRLYTYTTAYTVYKLLAVLNLLTFSFDNDSFSGLFLIPGAVGMVR